MACRHNSTPPERQAGAEERFRVRLVQLGRSYGGVTSGFVAACESEPAKDRWTFKLRIEDGAFREGVWKVTRWSQELSAYLAGVDPVPVTIARAIRSMMRAKA